MVENLDRTTISKKTRLSLLEETKRRQSLKQQTFKGGLYNVNSPRGCKQTKEFQMFKIPSPKPNCNKADPSVFFKEQLGISITDGISVVEGLKKKEFSCQTRKQYVDLANWLRNCLAGLQNLSDQNEITQETIFQYLQKIYNTCMLEIIQKTRVESTQKAAILQLVWQNILILPTWLEKYYKKKVEKDVQQCIIKNDQESRRYLFKIEDLRKRLNELGTVKNKQQSYFYQVVKDNRLLRTRNRKLLQKLATELDGNKFLKEENMKFYRDNQKMKLVIMQEGNLKQLEVLSRRLKELEAKLEINKKITKNNILKEVQATQTEELYQEEIKMIVKRINQEDLLDLDYQEPVKINNISISYANSSVQTEPNVQSRGTNTYIIIDIPKQEETQTQTQTNLSLNQMVIDLKIQQKIQHNTKQKSLTATTQRVSKVTPEAFQIKVSGQKKVSHKQPKSPRKSDEKAEENPQTFQQSVDKITNFYEHLSNIIDSLRMALVAVPTHEKNRLQRETRVFASKAFGQIKKLFAHSNLIPLDRQVTQDKSRFSQSSPSHKRAKSSRTNSQQGSQLRLIQQNQSSGDQSEEESHKKLRLQPPPGQNALPRKSILSSRRSSVSPIPTEFYNSRRASDSSNSFCDFIAPMSKLEPTSKKRTSNVKSLTLNTLSDECFDTIIEFEEKQPDVQTKQSLKLQPLNQDPKSIKTIDQTQQKKPVKHQRPIPRYSRIFKENQLYRFPTQVTEVTQQNTPRPPKKFIITSNFQTKQQLIQFFQNAIRKPQNQTKISKPVTKLQQPRENKKVEQLAMSSPLVKDCLKALLNQDTTFGTQAKEQKPMFMSILGKVEQALSAKDKQLEKQLKLMQNKRSYSKAMVKRFFLFLMREIYKNKDKVFFHDVNFQTFLEQWILQRYGLSEICHEVTSKIKSSVDKLESQSPEFKCLHVLMKNNKGDKIYFSKGIFRIFVIFLEFGAQKTGLLKAQNCNPNISLSEGIEFIKNVLCVFLGQSEISKFVDLLASKYNTQDVINISPKIQINLFQLFTDVEQLLETQSQNLQFSLLMKSLCEILTCSTSQYISLESLYILWSILQPNQSELQKNILILIKFCSTHYEDQKPKLIIPIFKLTLLARRFGWSSILYPIDIVNDRYQRTFPQSSLTQITMQWEKQRQLIKSNMPQYPQIIELLDMKVLRFKVNSVLKEKSETFPLLLYRFTKLAVSNDLFNQFSKEFIDTDLDIVSKTLAQYERDLTIRSLNL